MSPRKAYKSIFSLLIAISLFFYLQRYDKSLIYTIYEGLLTNRKLFEQIGNPILNKIKIQENISEKGVLKKCVPLQRNFEQLSFLY